MNFKDLKVCTGDELVCTETPSHFEGFKVGQVFEVRWGVPVTGSYKCHVIENSRTFALVSPSMDGLQFEVHKRSTDFVPFHQLPQFKGAVYEDTDGVLYQITQFSGKLVTNGVEQDSRKLKENRMRVVWKFGELPEINQKEFLYELWKKPGSLIKAYGTQWVCRHKTVLPEERYKLGPLVESKDLLVDGKVVGSVNYWDGVLDPSSVAWRVL